MRFRALSGKEFCRVLERHGWEEDTIEGSHHSYVKDGYDYKIVVPVHGNNSLARGLQATLMRAADIRADDLVLKTRRNNKRKKRRVI
jgi:predicted RNA binding protein YcfA (HicA-like mRNA interferase family)